jgi:hypothetical protein
MGQFKNDNLWSAGLRTAKRLANRSFYLSTEAPHFQFEVNGEWYVFCAIHKNASSSIRALVETASPKERGADTSLFDFLFANHLVRKRHEIERAKHLMVFVRHPVERMISCFANKFIQQKGNRSIFHDYAKVTGANPQHATFNQFVNGYMRPCFRGRKVKSRHNRHIYTQQQQLLPVNYNVVAPVEQFSVIVQVLGLGYLLPERINATSGAGAIPGASSMTAEELHALYQKTGKTPDMPSLLREELLKNINDLYHVDLKAFGR